MTQQPEVLDLYCGAGGFGKGLADAGFSVEGVDIEPRPNYPFMFYQADALQYLDEIIRTGEIKRYALISAGPPCQANNPLTVGTNKSRGWGRAHVDLLPATRALLDESGVPYVLEQPNGRAVIRKDLTLCGEMFGLGVIRHRNFELGGWKTERPEHIKHRGRVRGHRHGEWHDGPYVAAYGNGGGKATVPEMQDAMRIPWTDVRDELTEAVPPAYAEWVGKAFLSQLERI
jgi:hypothetical protein